MTKRACLAALAFMVISFAAPMEVSVAETTAAPHAAALPGDVWQAWRQRFVAPEGRVIDNVNGNISHTEGQGYGMLFAAFAGDRPTFDKLWAWTVTNLGIRDDALFAWRFDPRTNPAVSDRNNATDGDILIAWALMEAAGRFTAPDYRRFAALIARAIAAKTFDDSGTARLLLPAAAGFSARERKDGPVVNLSYWVYPALPALKAAAPEYDWDRVFAAGLDLTTAARFGKHQLPPDWISLAGGRPAPATGFPAEFGWNAIRVPLYLAWAGNTGPVLAPFVAWARQGGRDPQVIDVIADKPVKPFGGAPYGAVTGLVACAVDNVKLDDAVRTAPMEQYYPSTLRLLALAAAAARYPQCL